ncbi:MAG: FecR domain-containing protein [Brasilonema angustatum HA4187-MV1]|jgi:hypothetical protein|nr:FecR domain-containing protein [Brasilonema angustatum HA4187-MV1]
MFRKFFLLIIISFWGVVVLPVPKQADATTPLTAAVIQDLRNLVQLMPYKNSKRQARKSDSMSPRDKLSTGRSALADLRFNDGSWARIGEQAVFQFLPQKRNFSLYDGTVVLLIPPGRGQTRISTPNAAAAIRGSALFVRYDPQTETTIVGALTNSGIQVSNKDASRKQELKAGQLIVLVKGELKGLYDFDLRTFYQTSTLVRDLNLTLKNGMPSKDAAIASVQAETAAAVAAQSPLTGQDVVENPSFIKPTTYPDLPTSNNVTRDHSPVNTLLEAGEVVPNAVSSSTSKPSRSTTPTDSVTPPINQPTGTSTIVTPSQPVNSSPTPTQPTVTLPNPATPSLPTPTLPTVTAPQPVIPSLPTPTLPTVTAPQPVIPSLPTPTLPTVTAPQPVIPSLPTPTLPTVTAPQPATPSLPTPTLPTVTAPQPATPSLPTPTLPAVTAPQPATPSLPTPTQPIPTTTTQPSVTPVKPST